MTHRASARFWHRYQALAEDVRDRADRAFQLLQLDPHHPSLRLKKVGAKWSVRVDREHRALAIETTDGLLWTWIGTHDAYMREIASR
jgi:hypothetical protein